MHRLFPNTKAVASRDIPLGTKEGRPDPHRLEAGECANSLHSEGVRSDTMPGGLRNDQGTGNGGLQSGYHG